MKERVRKTISLLIVFIMLLLTVAPNSFANTSIKSVIRIAGWNRYDTAIVVAKELQVPLKAAENNGFENIVIATGSDFADALGGGYLTGQKKAPMLLYNKSDEDYLISITKRDIKKGGTVYILGGKSAVSKSVDSKLKNAGIKVKRLEGNDRFGTNLKILSETYKSGDEILIAKGTDFADSLSASAVSKPLMLVGKSLTKNQKNWLSTNKVKKAYIIGGTAAVGTGIETALRGAGIKVERVKGSNRYDTSYQIAMKFHSKAGKVTLATGKSYPDGLTGAAYATVSKSPIILVANDSYMHAKKFIDSKSIVEAYIIGGTSAISDKTIENITGTQKKATQKNLTFMGYYVDPNGKTFFTEDKGRLGIILRNDTGKVIGSPSPLAGIGLSDLTDARKWKGDINEVGVPILPGQSFMISEAGVFGITKAIKFGFSFNPNPVYYDYDTATNQEVNYVIKNVKPSISAKKKMVDMPKGVKKPSNTYIDKDYKTSSKIKVVELSAIDNGSYFTYKARIKNISSKTITLPEGITGILMNKNGTVLKTVNILSEMDNSINGETSPIIKLKPGEEVTYNKVFGLGQTPTRDIEYVYGADYFTTMINLDDKLEALPKAVKVK